MTKQELIDMLEDYPDDMPVVIQGCNSDYCDSPDHIRDGAGVCSFWGKNYKAIVIKCDDQVGRVACISDLDLDEEDEME